MLVFNGILNNNGIEKKIRLFLKNSSLSEGDQEIYETDFFMEDIKSIAFVHPTTIVLSDSKYQIFFKKYEDEILLMGKETSTFCDLFTCAFPCFHKPKFFVMTNKEEV